MGAQYLIKVVGNETQAEILMKDLEVLKKMINLY